VDEKRWKSWKEKLPRSHDWACDFVVKTKNKGSVRGGFIIGKKKEWKLGKCNLIAKKGEGVIRSELEVDKESIVIISVYGEQGRKNLTEGLNVMTKVEREENVIIRGDFEGGT